MKEQINRNIRLGLFVVAGGVFLVLLLYMIGKNQNLFGNTYVLKARFENVQGLMIGNNVRFAGNEAGTVKKISILNDTLIEVTLVVDATMQTVIRKNAIVSIGTEGLVGNRVVNIIPAKTPAPLALDGDILMAKRALDTDDMLQTLAKTNRDVSVIARGLTETVKRINESDVFWDLMRDPTVKEDVRQSLHKLQQSTKEAAHFMYELNRIVEDVKLGKGSLGKIIYDTSYAEELQLSLAHIHDMSMHADSLMINAMLRIDNIDREIQTGKGTLHALLKDSLVTKQFEQSIEQIRQGAAGFNQNMEALKHSFLLRGYFRKQQRK